MVYIGIDTIPYGTGLELSVINTFRRHTPRLRGSELEVANSELKGLNRSREYDRGLERLNLNPPRARLLHVVTPDCKYRFERGHTCYLKKRLGNTFDLVH